VQLYSKTLAKYLRVSQPKSNLLGRIAFGAAFAMIMGNLLATTLLATTSIANYPGGEALASFNEKYASVAGGKGEQS
jgi:alpha-1,6-mannosyltransferase